CQACLTAPTGRKRDPVTAHKCPTFAVSGGSHRDLPLSALANPIQNALNRDMRARAFEPRHRPAIFDKSESVANYHLAPHRLGSRWLRSARETSPFGRQSLPQVVSCRTSSTALLDGGNLISSSHYRRPI